MESIEIDAAEPVFGIQLKVTLNVHERGQCAGEWCCIHNPSDHHMQEWPLNWRGDRRIMERLCPHGVGHPDPDDAAFRRRVAKKHSAYFDQGAHGCDGCCVEGVFFNGKND